MMERVFGRKAPRGRSKMKKYLLLLILILFLTFTLLGDCDWLAGWDKRIELAINDYAGDIGGAVTWFPVDVFLTATQGEEVFVELTTDAEYLKVAFTKADGTTELYADCELFDVSEEKGIYHMSRAGWTINANTSIYMYYDKDHADNTNYIGATNTEPAFEGLVTFVFDDGPDTNLSIKTLFDAQGEVACAAIPTDYIGTGGYMTWANVITLQAGGWEILNHGETHTNLTTLNEAQIRAEFDVSQALFKANGITPTNMAYPHADTNETVTGVVQEYFRSGRLGGVYVNPQIIDVYVLVSRHADDHTLINDYKADVDIAKAGNRWVIFYIHSTDEDDETMLNTLIDYIQAEGVDIVTINQGLDIFAPISTSVWDRNFKLVYHMADKTTSTVQDSTSKSNDGAKKGANEPVEATGKVGQAQDFDGVNDYIRVPASTDLNPETGDFTVEVVFNGAAQTFNRLASNKEGNVEGWVIQGETGTDAAARFAPEDHNGTEILCVGTGSTLYDTNWHYLVGIRNTTGDTIEMYADVDGDTRSLEDTTTVTINSTNDLYIGSASDGTTSPFDGIIDEFRISKAVRSAAWRKGTYNSLWDTLLTYGSEEIPVNVIFFSTPF